MLKPTYPTSTSFVRRHDGSQDSSGMPQDDRDGPVANTPRVLSFLLPSPGYEAKDSSRGLGTPRTNQQSSPPADTPRVDTPGRDNAVGSSTPRSPCNANQQPARSVEDWAKDQQQFSHLPKLPDGWIRVKSRTTGAIYYCYTETGETILDEPTGPPPSQRSEKGLPRGWVEMVSRSTGRAYYWNSQLQKSQYNRPVEATPASPRRPITPPPARDASGHDSSLKSSPSEVAQSIGFRLDEEDSMQEAQEAAKSGSDLKMDYEMIGVHAKIPSQEASSQSRMRFTEPVRPQWMQQIVASQSAD